MTIREYRKTDEPGWVRCRLISFLDSSYFDDIRHEKELYDHLSVSLVAEENEQIVGIIDVEYEETIGEVCYLKGSLGATIWHLGVLPEYRNKNVATSLWEAAKAVIVGKGVERIEVWTQDDIAANRWYEKQGFTLRESYLNAFIRGGKDNEVIRKYINFDQAGDVLGIRCLNFEAPIERKQELEEICYRLHEVRVYELNIQ